MFFLHAKKSPGREPWEYMAQQLYRWKILQCLICLVNIITSAWLAGYIGSRDLDQGTLPAFVVVAGVSFVFTGLSSWFGHHLDGFQRRTCMSLFMAFDITCMGTQVAAIVLLTAGNLPWNCHDLAHVPGDYRDPKAGFDTVGFGDNDTEGELDRFCPMPRMNWVLSLLLLLSYIHTMGWSIRLVAALHRRARQTKADLETQRQAKLGESPAAQPARHADAAPHVQLPVAHVRGQHHPPPSHVVAPMPLPVPLHPRQSVFDDNGNDGALVSDGSWSSPGPTPAASPPAYEEGEDSKKAAPPREK